MPLLKDAHVESLKYPTSHGQRDSANVIKFKDHELGALAWIHGNPNVITGCCNREDLCYAIGGPGHRD